MPYSIYLQGSVLDAAHGERVPGCTVEVRYDSSTVATIKPDRKGRFKVELDGGHYVQVYFSAPGQVDKHVVVDTRGVPPLLDVPEVVLNVDVILFEPLAGTGMEIFEEPRGKAAYKHSVRNIVWDTRYEKAMRAKIRAFIKRYDREEERKDDLVRHL